ncbi:MAG: GH3 auxin-responsive promoter family protein, partial [bacterium]
MRRAFENGRVILANSLWFLSCLPGLFAFLLASRHVRRAQTRVLSGILKHNSATEMGRTRRFELVLTPDDYKSVPLSDYEDVAPWIVKVKAGKAAVLTCDPVVVLQPTSGSTAATKLIPYTRSLRKEFGAAVDPWIASLYLTYPALLLGRHYWAISPTTRCPQDSSSQVPVGFADDAEYLGRTQRFLTRTLFAVPSEISRVTDPNAFEYLTLLFLLAEKNLRVISVWHPSFLTVLLRAIPRHLSSVANDIESGLIDGRVDVSPDLRRSLGSRLSANPARAKELRAIDIGQPDFPARLWPHLRVISCWTDGRPEPWLTEIVRCFPRAAIQGKGLTATEGIVSFPMGRSGRRVCAVRSHFLEFIDVETGEVKRAWETTPGRDYGVALTTQGGLYRYRLHDLVRVTGFFQQAPCLAFVARDNLVSDLVGEKLNSRHVEESIRRTESDCGVRLAFAMLAPLVVDKSAGYVLFAQTVQGVTVEWRKVRTRLE